MTNINSKTQMKRIATLDPSKAADELERLRDQCAKMRIEYGVKIESLKSEINRLERIIAQELSENDELGCEYTYVRVLKEEIKALVAVIEEAIRAPTDVKRMVADLVTGLERARKAVEG